MPDGTAPRRDGARFAAWLDAQYRSMAAPDMLAEMLTLHFPGRIALVSSFGAESAVLLHMVAEIDRATPVIFLETGMLFPETLAYQRTLAAQLGLSDLRLVRPDATDLRFLDGQGDLHRGNPDGCCHLRKTLPLRRALQGAEASITGRKRAQGPSRADMPLVEADARSGKLRINPLAAWDRGQITAYMAAHDIPPHPLVAQGYPSIGCAPCTSRVGDGEEARAGRWRGQDKTECGIHFDGTRWIRGPGAGI
ncbi:MAG: phosphoadenylyl-sulfate reductase [Pseudomonadota bacterium]